MFRRLLQRDRTSITGGALVILGVFVLGFALYSWSASETCGGRSMSSSDRCLVNDIDGKRSEQLVKEHSLPPDPFTVPTETDWEEIKPGDKIRTTTAWEVVVNSDNARTLDQQKKANRRTSLVVLLVGALSIAIGSLMASHSRRRRRI